MKYSEVKSFRHIKVGDTITRIFAGKPQQMKVSEITEGTLVAGLGWTFCRDTGWEIDEDLRWGPSYGRTGSYLAS